LRRKLVANQRCWRNSKPWFNDFFGGKEKKIGGRPVRNESYVTSALLVISNVELGIGKSDVISLVVVSSLANMEDRER
jgi:hypothetical protein